VGLVWTLAWLFVSPAESGMISIPDPAKPDPGITGRVHTALGTLPLSFIENQGQLDDRVAYYIQGRDTAIYFTSKGVAFALTGPAPWGVADALPRRAAVRPVAFGAAPDSEATRQRCGIMLEFLGANPDVKPVGLESAPAVVSYFKGPREQWKTGLPTYASVVYSDLWPGIDLVYAGNAGRLKYTFLVKPGADPSRIRLRYEGQSGVRQTPEGGLRVETPVGDFEEKAPYAYQGESEDRVEVEAQFAPAESPGSKSYRFGFRVGAYDRTKVLVLDPVMLSYCGYIGGAGVDDVWGMAVDSSGNAYVSGRTQSTQATFPETAGAFDTTFG